MPAQQGLGFDEEARPVSPGQDTADRSEQRPVGRFEPGACDLAAEHGELVTQHQGDLCGVMVEASQYRPQPSANSQLTSYKRVSAPHGHRCWNWLVARSDDRYPNHYPDPHPDGYPGHPCTWGTGLGPFALVRTLAA